jgi:hypothetical protein
MEVLRIDLSPMVRPNAPSAWQLITRACIKRREVSFVSAGQCEDLLQRRMPAIVKPLRTDMSNSTAPQSNDGPRARKKMPRGGWLVAGVLGALFGAAMWFAFYGWNLVPNEMNGNGYIAMALGIVFTAALGGGLMALVFWSHKKGYDR